MADLIRMGGIVGIPKDRLGSPSSGSDDGGVGVDLADLAHELDADEFDGPLLVNGAYQWWRERPLNPSNVFYYVYNILHLFFIIGDRPAIIAPPESEWYHGRLDRYSSEQRLRNAGKLGNYLVRESDRKPGSYVLSYLGRTGINHFR